MRRKRRYPFYGLIFALGLFGLIVRTPILLGCALLVAVIIGFVVDRFDNRKDEPFKHYNAKHGHYRAPRED
jgi:uncharacterized membrane protein YraQ (UPF0718 family)